jgi:hypothetical protein
MISFNSSKFAQFALFANLAPAVLAKAIGSNGFCVFPSGVVFVFAQIGVTALA